MNGPAPALTGLIPKFGPCAWIRGGDAIAPGADASAKGMVEFGAVSVMTTVDDQLNDFVQAAQTALGDDLLSIVLFGSAAEGRLRPTSDVNVLLLLKRFDRARMDQLREPLRLAHAAIRLAPMFVLRDELEPATRAFAVKFREIKRRHKLLHGSDPFATIEVSRASSVLRLRQELLNLALRLRQTYMLRSLREEQLVFAIADAAGPLRAAAATLIELRGEPPLPPKEALSGSRTRSGRKTTDSSRRYRGRESTRAPRG